MRTFSFLVPLVAVLALGVSAAASGTTALHPVVRATLSGHTGPPKGAPDGSGRAVIRLNAKLRRACWTISVRGIKKPLSAHVRKAPPGKIGPVIIPLGARFVPTGCVYLPHSATILALEKHPRAYYVDVLTRKYLNGALRGQLRAG